MVTDSTVAAAMDMLSGSDLGCIETNRQHAVKVGLDKL